MAAALRSQVSGSYRNMLRTINEVFAGDAKGLRTGWVTARQGFRANAGVSDPDAIAKLVAEARDAADFLRHHIVQAKSNEAGRFELRLKDTPDADADGTVTVQTPSESLSKPKEGCCGGGCS